jgi:hypothetical protein
MNNSRASLPTFAPKQMLSFSDMAMGKREWQYSLQQTIHYAITFLFPPNKETSAYMFSTKYKNKSAWIGKVSN